MGEFEFPSGLLSCCNSALSLDEAGDTDETLKNTNIKGQAFETPIPPPGVPQER